MSQAPGAARLSDAPLIKKIPEQSICARGSAVRCLNLGSSNPSGMGRQGLGLPPSRAFSLVILRPPSGRAAH